MRNIYIDDKLLVHLQLVKSKSSTYIFTKTKEIICEKILVTPEKDHFSQLEIIQLKL